MNNDPEIIICRPQVPNLAWRILVVLMGGITFGASIWAIIWALILGPSYISLYQGWSNVSLSAFVGAGIYWSVRMVFRKEVQFYWTLTKDALIQGDEDKKVLPLNTLTKIVVGAPPPNKMERFFIMFDSTGLAAAQYNYSMVLKFNTGEIVRLFLLAHPGGQELMEELYRRCNSLVDSTYQFTQEESRLLNVFRFPSSMNKVFRTDAL